MAKHALVSCLALAIFIILAASGTAQQSGDACGLLQTAEIQVLGGTAKVGAGAPTTDPLGSRLCRFQWGSGGNVTSGRSILDLSVTPTSKVFPGMDSPAMRQGLLASVKPGDPNAAVIPAIGAAAIYQSNAKIRIETTALVKTSVLIITYESADARAKKDQVIALLKAAAGRL